MLLWDQFCITNEKKNNKEEVESLGKKKNKSSNKPHKDLSVATYSSSRKFSVSSKNMISENIQTPISPYEIQQQSPYSRLDTTNTAIQSTSQSQLKVTGPYGIGQLVPFIELDSEIYY